MSRRRLRVLHVRTVRGTGGGPDKTVLKSCRALTDAGHVCEAFYLLDARADSSRITRQAAELGVTLHTAAESSAVSGSAVWALHRTLRVGRYDIFHTHDYKSSALARLLHPEHGYRVVSTAHGYNQTTRREGWYYALEKALFRFVDAVIAPNRPMARLLLQAGVRPARLHVIHNGIDLSERPAPRWPRALHDPPRLVYLGRLSAEKAPANAVEAVRLLGEQGVDLRLTLAGDGPERDALRAQIDRAGLAEGVSMPGFVSDVMGLLDESDVLVNPSDTECMPNSVLEAMTAGAAIVATDVGGVGEMIRDGREGLLVPPGDPSALARAIRRMIDPRTGRESMARAARRRVERRFSFASRMEAMLRLYRQVTAR